MKGFGGLAGVLRSDDELFGGRGRCERRGGKPISSVGGRKRRNKVQTQKVSGFQSGEVPGGSQFD